MGEDDTDREADGTPFQASDEAALLAEALGLSAGITAPATASAIACQVVEDLAAAADSNTGDLH